MTRRYDSSIIKSNYSSRYSKLFSDRKIKYLRQYSTPILEHPSVGEIKNLEIISHTWKLGDKLWKLAYNYYSGRSDLWWVIAWFNQTPTEGHINIGDIVMIPLPLERIFEYYGL